MDDELIEAAIEYGRPLELPPRPGHGSSYVAFRDSAGGVGADSYTISVGHKEGEAFVIDLIRGTTGKFDPAEVTSDYAKLLQEYGISRVVGDYYAAEWQAGCWSKCNISYARSEINKSKIYLETIPLFARRLVRLPEHRTLLRELRLLELHTHSGGRDVVDHPRGGHDDYANAVAGVLHQLSNSSFDPLYRGWCDDDENDPNGADAWAAARLSLYLQSGGRIRL